MLKNDYLVAKIGVDTAENEPSEDGPFDVLRSAGTGSAAAAELQQQEE